MYKIVFFLSILALSFTHIKGQNPSYFIVGEEQLAGIHIYDITQDADRSYWLATNQGIIKFDGYDYKFINNPQMLSNSVFNIKYDSVSNAVFCNNLSGQIFKIKNDTCGVYFNVPDSLMDAYLSYEFATKNQLIIVAKSIFKIDEHKKIKMLLPIQKPLNGYSLIFRIKGNTYLTYKKSTNQIVEFNENGLIKNHITLINDNLNLFFIKQNNNSLYLNSLDGTIIGTNQTFFNPPRKISGLKNFILYSFSDNYYLWLCNPTGGVQVFDNLLKPLFNGISIFNNFIISSIYKDHEGNFVLGTFDNGLIVIPDIHSIEFQLPDGDKISRISAFRHHSMLLGTQHGHIIMIDSLFNTSKIEEGGQMKVELLKYFSTSNHLFFNKKYTAIYDFTSQTEIVKNIGSVKDVFQVKKNHYVLATNTGLYNLKTENSEFIINQLTAYKERASSVAYDSVYKTYYVGTSSGLKIGAEKQSNLFLLDGKPVIASGISMIKNVVYVATYSNGVLVFKKNRLVDHWTSSLNLISNKVFQIKHYKNRFYLSTDKGLQILNAQAKPIYIINKSNGLYSNTITNFEIAMNKIWIVHHKSLQIFDINRLNNEDFTPTISIKELIVNDVRQALDKNPTYTYQQNHFKFTVSSNSMRYSDELFYEYKLDGLEAEWHRNSYNDNSFEYKSLPYGKYQFMVKAVFRNHQSQTISYSFQIKPPIWATWWFYLAMGILFITITFFTFQYQIQKQRNKLRLQNELNAAKLIAIRSQMNPHFIFNAINSIQDLILQGDIENSYSYVIKFSKLVRLTLDFSGQEFIDIEDEIELLTIYLELEKLRFKDDFVYQINTENIDDIQVPPMMIQPFVENAIKHGLLHREGFKELTIDFKKTDIFTCTIIDNGIGRKKAEEINRRQRKQHRSFSLNATKTRFDIMKNQYHNNLGITYIDLEENNLPTGTKVIIKIPFKQNY